MLFAKPSEDGELLVLAAVTAALFEIAFGALLPATDPLPPVPLDTLEFTLERHS